MQEIARLLLARNMSKSNVNSSLQGKIITAITSVNIYGVLIIQALYIHYPI